MISDPDIFPLTNDVKPGEVAGPVPSDSPLAGIASGTAELPPPGLCAGGSCSQGGLFQTEQWGAGLDQSLAAPAATAISGGNIGSERAVKLSSNWRQIYAAYQAVMERCEAARLGDPYGVRLPSIPQVARMLAVDQTTLWRIVKVYAVRDAQAGQAFKPKFDNCGKESDFAGVLENPLFTAKLLEIYAATIGGSGGNVIRGRRTAKLATALTLMADEPECPPELAARLRRGRFPVCFSRWLKQVTPEIENRFRGSKAAKLNNLESRRDLTVRFPDGRLAELPAGGKWVFDDMSVNQPYWAQLGGQILFSRQGLYALDHRSLRWLGKLLVARPREAYRAEDVLRFLHLLFELYGKPDLIVFEKGVWKARKIHGFKVTSTQAVVADEGERPEMSEAERGELQRGLEVIGIRVIFANSAHGKIIETCFNHLQDVLAVKAREYVNIGRHAGEFEIGAKRLRQVRVFQKSEGLNGRSPAEVGFAPATVLSDLIDAAFAHINGKTNSRGEVPDEVWTRDTSSRPLLPLTPDDARVFLPELREATLRGGRVTVQVDGRPQDFRADWMVQLGHGYRVYVRFDPAEPTRGAMIYNRETGSGSRRLEDATRPYADQEPIGWAAWEMPAPSADVTTFRGVDPVPATEFYGAGAVDGGDTVRRRQERLVATFFSAMPRPGQPAVKQREARTGDGRVARLEAGHEARGTGHEAGGLPGQGSEQRPILRADNPLAASTPEEFGKRSARLRAQGAAARALLQEVSD